MRLIMRNLQNVFIVAGGIILIFFGLFHAAFWHLFDWSSELKELQVVNGNIMQMLNVGIICLLVSFGIILLIYRREVALSGLGRVLLFALSLFFFVRGVLEFVYPESSFLLGVVLFLVAMIFLIPALWKTV